MIISHSLRLARSHSPKTTINIPEQIFVEDDVKDMNHCSKRADKHLKDLAAVIVALRISSLHSQADFFFFVKSVFIFDTTKLCGESPCENKKEQRAVMKIELFESHKEPLVREKIREQSQVPANR